MRRRVAGSIGYAGGPAAGLPGGQRQGRHDTQQVQLGDFFHLTTTIAPTAACRASTASACSARRRYPGRLSVHTAVQRSRLPLTGERAARTALISEAVLWDPATTRIAIYRGATEVAGRNVSPHTPVVTIQAPHGGETFTGTFSVQWQASDGDNEPLTYLLQYSADGGATWRPLSGIISGRSAR